MLALSLAAGSRTPALKEKPKPHAGPGELLIRVRAAGVITTEVEWSPTTQTKSGEPRTDATLGHEFSGIVKAVGDGVAGVAIDSEVFGMNDWYADGATAAYCVAPYEAVAPKPRRLSPAEAASVPISALTAWQGLFERARMQSGDSVLVHGGAGAVGTWAVQLASVRGAEVTATASAANAAFVTELGARRVIDYRTERFEDAGPMDVVFDTVGGETLERSFSMLRPGGRLVTIVSSAENTSDPRIREAFFIVEPNRQQLIEIGALLDDGRVRAIVDSVVPLAQAAEAYVGSLPRQRRGKVVISIAEEGGEKV